MVPLCGPLEVFGGNVDDGDAGGAQEQADEAAKVREEVDDVIDNHLLDNINGRTREQKFHLKKIFSRKLKRQLFLSSSSMNWVR